MNSARELGRTVVSRSGDSGVYKTGASPRRSYVSRLRAVASSVFRDTRVSRDEDGVASSRPSTPYFELSVKGHLTSAASVRFGGHLTLAIDERELGAAPEVGPAIPYYDLSVPGSVRCG